MGPFNKANYFIGLRITNTQVLERIGGLQSELISKFEYMKKHEEAPSKSHITLAVMHLSDDESVDQCRTLLEQFKPQYSREERTISFTGLGAFGSKVLFAKPDKGIEFLKKLRSDLHEVLSESDDIKVLEKEREFNPHLTLFKLRNERRGRKGEAGKSKISLGDDINSYSDYDFGEQIADEIELLSMNKKKAEDGYYHSEGKFSLVEQE